MTFTISVLSLVTMSFGTPERTDRPHHEVDSKPGKPCCEIGGISGASGDVSRLEMPRALNLPALILGIAVATPPNVRWTAPVIVSCSASGAPLYGTWTMSRPASFLKSSPARCGGEPLPGDELLS